MTEDRRAFHENMANTQPFADVLYLAPELKGKPYAAAVWLAAARHDPQGCVAAMDSLRRNASAIPNLPDVLKEVAARTPTYFLAMAKNVQLPGMDAAKAVAAASPKLVEDVAAAYDVANMISVCGAPDAPIKNKALYAALPQALANVFRASTPNAAQHKEHALQAVRQINDLHEQDNALRFHATERMSADQLYELMTLGRAELYTSTFKGLNERFIAQLDATHRSPLGPMLSTPARRAQIGTYLEVCASFDALDPLLARLSPKQTSALADVLVQQVIDGKDAKAALTLSEVMDHCKNPQLQAMLEQKLHTAHDNANGIAKDILALVAAEHGRHHPKAAEATLNGYFASMAKEERFAYHHRSEFLSNAQTVDKAGRHFQAQVFYNDPDGKASFQHFLDAHRNPKQFTITDHGSYVDVVNVQGKIKIHLVASKPESDGDGLKDIQRDMAAMHPPASLQSVVHRGHSYHLYKTLEALYGCTAPFVFLGSCGGYNDMDSTVKSFPEAQILSTRGTGTMAVNDLFLTRINQRISEGKEVVWDGLWNEMAASTPDKRFDAYVNPSDNKAIHFLKKVDELRHSQSMWQEIGLAFQSILPKMTIESVDGARGVAPASTASVAMPRVTSTSPIRYS